MTSAAEMTAAEKAEARRLKILAKKNARMKYAAGDRSQLPSTAPAEEAGEVPPATISSGAAGPSTPSTNGEHSDISRDQVAPVAVSALSAGPSAMLAGSSSAITTPVPRAEQRPTAGWLSAPSHQFHLPISFVSAVTFAALCATDVLPDWNVSVFHVFVLLQLCMLSPTLLSYLQRRAADPGRSLNGSPAGILGLLIRVGHIASVVNRLWKDFTVFFLAFLCTWYFLRGP